MSKIHLGVPLLVYFLAAATPAAEAQDADVVGRLTQHGGLNKRDARSLVGEVSRKMQNAADSFSGMNDPVRRAMRIAVFGAVSTGPQQDMVNDAKARLYLYAGLNGRALALLFRPGPTAVSSCMTGFGLSQGKCEALVAAAAQRPVAEIRKQQSARQQMPATYGYGAAQPAFPARPMPAQTYRPAVPARPMPVQRPVARPAPARPPPGPNANTAAAYQARRAAYLAKFKDKMNKKKEPPPAAPAAEPAPAAAPAAAAPSAPAAAPAAAAPPAPEAAKPAPAAKPKKKKKKAEPDPLIDGLLADPLGKSK